MDNDNIQAMTIRCTYSFGEPLTKIKAMEIYDFSFTDATKCYSQFITQKPP